MCGPTAQRRCLALGRRLRQEPQGTGGERGGGKERNGGAAPRGRSLSDWTSSAGPSASTNTPGDPPGVPWPCETRKQSVSAGTTAADTTPHSGGAAAAAAAADPLARAAAGGGAGAGSASGAVNSASPRAASGCWTASLLLWSQRRVDRVPPAGRRDGENQFHASPVRDMIPDPPALSRPRRIAQGT